MLRVSPKVASVINALRGPLRTVDTVKYHRTPVVFAFRTRPTPTRPTVILNRTSFLHHSCRRSDIPSSDNSPFIEGTTTFSDPARPDLFYHLVSPPTPISTSQPAFALSFTASPPERADSSAVIGWLPAVYEQRPERENGQSQEEACLEDFKENPKFRDLLHNVIQDGLREGIDEIQVNNAIQMQQGWMHIHDERNVPPLGRIGDPDDIIASVLVENGKILPETYQAMPAYRLCTTDGITRLTPGLTAKFHSVLV
ncbi:hypothetical protein AX17_001633 [Amanita inopinata Kibby_2008]|nr:hypothetical protein AX17_001633 [Amanita inopinata Kibby_2008]